jgi:hypothetical protein
MKLEAFSVEANMYNRDEVVVTAVLLTLVVLAMLVGVLFILKAAEII